MVASWCSIGIGLLAMPYTSVRASSSSRTSDSVSSMPIISRMRSSPSTRHESMPGIHAASPPKSRTTFHTSPAGRWMSISFVALPMAEQHFTRVIGASRGRRGAASRSRQSEGLVVGGPDSLDLGEQLGPSARVQQEATRLARDVGAEVVALLRERGEGHVALDHLAPPLLGGGVDLDRVVAVVPGMDERLGDEIDLITVVPGVVPGGGMRPTGEEEVRKPRRLHAEERRRTLCPVVFERESVAATDSHAQERACAEIEAGRPDDDVELTLTVDRLDPARGHAQDRCRPEVDERDVRLVERLVVVGDEGRALLAEAVILRDELLGRLRIVDDAAHLLGQELAPLRVGGVVEQQVEIVARELGEAGAEPHLLEERSSLFGRIVGRLAVVGLVKEPVYRRVEHLTDGLEVRPQLPLLAGGDRRVVQRGAPVGGALVHGQRRHLVGDDGDDLYATRSGTYDRDPPAG